MCVAHDNKQTEEVEEKNVEAFAADLIKFMEKELKIYLMNYVGNEKNEKKWHIRQQWLSTKLPSKANKNEFWSFFNSGTALAMIIPNEK